MADQPFSKKYACMLVDLCAAAESGDEPVCIRQEGDDLFAAFRGSGDPAEPLNVRGNRQAEGLPLGKGLGYGPLVEAYRAAVSGKLSTLSASRVWLAGHGIGGAFALLAASELMASTGNVAAVYTFGAPRVADSQFAASLGCPVFRVVNNLDVMDSLPPPWKWRHAGKQILINADGSLNLHPNALNRLPSLLRQTVWLGELMAQGLASGYPRALHTLLNQVLGDHALEAYSTRLHALPD
jgi:pimeloyl-ACP methyl ester carboxylesterase